METTMSIQAATAPINWDTQVSLKLLVESMPIAVVIVDSRGRIVYVNAKLDEMFAYAPGELFGHPVETLIPEHFRQSHVQHRQGYMKHLHVRSMGSGMDLAGRRKDGTEFPLEAGLSTLRLQDEVFVVVTVTDISKRKEVAEVLARQVEERTKEIERRRQAAEGLRGILSTLITNHSLSESLEHIAAESARLLSADLCAIYSHDSTHDTLQSQVISGHMPDDLKQTLVNKLTDQSRLFNEPLVFLPSHAALPAFGYTTPNSHQATENQGGAYLTVPVRDTQVYGLLLFGFAQPHALTDQDIDFALRMADLTVLAFANAHLRAQIEHSAIAAERSRIARDLHDAVTQTLFSASIIAGVLPTIWERNQADGRRRLVELGELTRGALAEMRTLLLELRPAKLVEVDLADLLRQLAEAISGRARVPVTVQVEGNTEVSADVKVAFYRVAQEALNNIAKHAQAHSAHIHLIRSPDEVRLSVSDDGVGFVFEHIAPQHLGLGIMRERADAIGASLGVHSVPNQGTKIEVCWRSKEQPADIRDKGNAGNGS
jgi:PAS domain S-box-containing protein